MVSLPFPAAEELLAHAEEPDHGSIRFLISGSATCTNPIFKEVKKYLRAFERSVCYMVLSSQRPRYMDNLMHDLTGKLSIWTYFHQRTIWMTAICSFHYELYENQSQNPTTMTIARA
ncbi:hypothetical protein FPOA_04015 [Fusarium poae]|uniref:Uncharacterized protein n=1 Tax=Fusarium poae TaxID=36050 RepID=A0A1B8ASX0_FUSPO|nr:hypothetical protein FPOA_04015 [Fusarium poae]